MATAVELVPHVWEMDVTFEETNVRALWTAPLQPTELWIVSATTCAVATAVTGLQRDRVMTDAVALALPALRAALAAAAAAAAVALELSRAA